MAAGWPTTAHRSAHGEYAKKPRPSTKDKEDTLAALNNISNLTGRSSKDKALKAIRDLKTKVEKLYPSLFGSNNRLLGAIYSGKVADPSRTGYQGGRTDTVYTYAMSDGDASNFVTASIAEVEAIQTNTFDAVKGTWLEFVKEAPALEFENSGDYKTPEFSDLADNAKVLLERPLDKLYNQDLGLVEAFIAVLEEAKDYAKQFESNYTRSGASAEDKAHGVKLGAFAENLSNFVQALKQYRLQGGKNTPFDKAFATKLPNLKASANIPEDYGGKDATGQDTRWTRSAKTSYSPPTSSSAYTSGSSSGSGSGSGGSGQSGPGSGPLYRQIEEGRVKQCKALVDKFVGSLNSADAEAASRVVSNAGTSLTQILGKIELITKGSDAEGSFGALDGLRAQRVRILLTCLTRVRGMLTRHRDRHVMFALRHNRSALRYMSFWRGAGMPKAASMTNEYFDKLAAATEKGKAQCEEITKALEAMMGKEDTYRGMTDEDIERTSDQLEALRMYRAECMGRISLAHSVPSTFLDQFMTDSHVHLIYALKVVRLALAYLAMRIATGAFSRIYASNVYIKNVDPPSPLLFLAIFFAVDAAVNLALLTILYSASKIFKSPTNEFPIDGYLLTAWCVDIVCVELAMLGIGVAFANIISTKKAFR
ncbi:MAG: hypothetical protein WDW38_006578 [Sanguina aurantia]